MENENKRLMDIVKLLEGASYFEWTQIKMIVDRKFAERKIEMERSLQFSAFEE